MPRGVPRNRVPVSGLSPTEPAPEQAVAFEPVDDQGLFVETAPQAPPPAPAYDLNPPLEPSAEQARIRELENLLALERGKKDVEPELEPVQSPGDQGNIIIHFLEDGLTAGGQVWYRGQEVEYEPGTRAYQDTFDRLGRTWLDLRSDDFAQVERWGKVMFRAGPWPGRRLSDSTVQFERVRNDRGEVVADPTPEELARFEQAEARRNRAAPRLEQMRR